MAGSVNKVILIGNLGKDPEIRHLESGVAVAKFPIATSETFKDRTTGEKKSQTEWHNITVWRGLAEVAEKFLKKGNQVYIEGKLKTRSWQDSEGITKYSTEVVADSMVMLGRVGDDSHNFSGAGESSENYGKAQSSTAVKNESFESEEDDDLPF